MFFRRQVRETLDAWRRKLIRETESALLVGLLQPQRHPRIPTILVGVGQFDPHWSRRWWSAVLELDSMDGQAGQSGDRSAQPGAGVNSD